MLFGVSTGVNVVRIGPGELTIAREWVNDGIHPFEVFSHKEPRHRIGQSVFSLKPYTNDIDTSTNAEQHLDAEEFLKRMKDMRFGGAILDPPFSNHQSREIYGSENLYTDPAKMKRIEMELGSLIELGGYVVKFGYNSNFSHKSFECIAVRLVRYGGSMNDMIISVHQRTISGDWF